ncbi:MAG: calcium/sodium antiporter, partial [Ruminococcus sp.]|nr:calcium/sodium antiporter [Ruminococcus sp.]
MTGLELLLNIVLLVLGFAALIKGADWFVDGSAALARTFRVPGVIIGLTIVAMGTSAPELAVSTSAALQGANEIALSNVTGSNIFNLLMVLGVCALIRPIPIERGILKRDFPLSIAAAVAVLAAVGLPMLTGAVKLPVGMAENVGVISRGFGIALLVVFAAYLTLLIILGKKNKTAESDEPPVPVIKSVLLIVFGVACIIIGGQLVVNNAVAIAAFFGMSQTLIGLTVVALGTSLPELVTSIVASRKGENALAVGNVVGSNLFNLLLILGVSATIHPIAVNFASVLDLGILIVVSVITLLFCLTKRISRVEGAVMVLLYASTIA